MKRILVFVLLGFLAKAQAQQSIAPYRMAVGFDKTSNIIFPYAVKSVDRGNAAVLVQKAKGVDNILQVKAARQGFPETNITVVTSDGRFYSFVVDYAEEPAPLNVSFVALAGGVAEMKDKPVNEAVFDADAAVVRSEPRFLGVAASGQLMRALLQGIWLKDGMEWFVLRLGNRSLVGYTPGYVRFFVRDRKRGKRTAVQETEVLPVYADTAGTVGGGGSRRLVFAFRPFTIPATQELVVQVGEKNGGRALVLHAGHKVLLKARLLLK